MTQNPVTVTYSLEEVLGQIIQKIDRLDGKVESLQKDVVEIKIEIVRLESEFKGDIKTLESELKGDIKTLETELKGDIKTLEAEVQGIGKRLDTQEFINRSVVVGFVLALAAGVVKLFFPSFPN
ncbi:MAG: hypothetical protein F6K21_30365 [Symploca sp. SIO2D2]|nr:hypothetical protein [Symploca sp. SIO2D2]